MSADIKTLRNALSAMHAVACGDSTRAYMSIPADPKRDADLLLSGALDELERLRAERDDLLAALKWALPFAEKYENTVFPGGPRQKLMEAKLAEVRAAIARAEGK